MIKHRMNYNMKKNVLKNIISLYGLTIAKLVFPLITLPYLTRVLSLDAYGLVSYVKSIISYIQIIIDFAFVVSGTKDIILAKGDLEKINKEVSIIMFSKILLSIVAFLVLIILTCTVPILSVNKIYVLLSFIPPFLSIFLFDYVFRGIEKMEVLTKRFFIMKSISTLLTFFVVKSDANILFIPILDIISSAVAVIMAMFELKKYHINPFSYKPFLIEGINKIKNSSIYFLSNVANIIFSSINTILIGIFLSTSDIAFWSLCIQIVNSIQNMYNPIIDGLYPEMIKTKDLSLIKRTFLIIMPIVLFGCVLTFFISKPALVVLGGEKYGKAYLCLRALIPVMFFGFPSMLFGWTTLGSIEKQKSVTITLIVSAIFQLICIGILLLMNSYNLFNISILRSLTEIVLSFSRSYCVYKYRKEFK